MSKGFFNTKTHCYVAATTCADHKIHFVYRAGTRTKPVVVEKLIGSPVPPQTGSRDPSLEQDLVLKSLWRSESRRKKTRRSFTGSENKFIYTHWIYLYQQENRSQKCHCCHHSGYSVLFTATQSSLLHPQDNRRGAAKLVLLLWTCSNSSGWADTLEAIRLNHSMIYSPVLSSSISHSQLNSISFAANWKRFFIHTRKRMI